MPLPTSRPAPTPTPVSAPVATSAATTSTTPTFTPAPNATSQALPTQTPHQTYALASPTPINIATAGSTPTPSSTQPPTHTPLPPFVPKLSSVSHPDSTPTSFATAVQKTTHTPTPKRPCVSPPSQRATPEQERVISSADSSSEHGFPQETTKILHDLAGQSPDAFDALMKRIGPLSRAYNEGYYFYETLLPYYQAIAVCDEAAAKEILGMPFLSDSYHDADRQEDYGMIDSLGGALWDSLSRLAEADLDGLERVLSHPDLDGGITNELTALSMLLALEQEEPEAAAAIQALPWVRDGIENKRRGDYHEDEGLGVADLVGLAWRSDESFWTLLNKPWVHDSFGEDWFVAVQSVFYLAVSNDRAATLVLQLFDQPGEPMYHMTLLMNGLMENHPDEFARILSSPELSNDEANDRRKAILLLQILRLTDPDAAATVEFLPFVQDGIDPREQYDIYWLWRIALVSDAVLTALADLSWVHDGLTPDELSATRILANVAGSYASTRDPLAAQRIAVMPFLKEVDTLDVGVLRALQNLNEQSREWDTSSPDYLWQVLSHPSLGGGIADTQRSVITVADVVVEARPELLDTVLDPEQTIVVERPIVLPLAGEVLLVTIWPGAPASQAKAIEEKAVRTINLLEHAVRHHEEFMGIPYPRKFVTAIVMDVEEDLERKRTSELVSTLGIAPEFFDAGDVIAYKAAYAYWRNSPDWRVSPGWISEGASTFLASRSENVRLGVPLPDPPASCSEFGSLREIGDLKFESGDYANANTALITCDRALGEGLFLRLFDAFKIEDFRQGFTTLSFVMKEVYEADSAGGFAACRNSTDWKFRHPCYLKEAFAMGEDAVEAHAVRRTIDRLYGRE